MHMDSSRSHVANYVFHDTIAFTKCLEDQETARTVYAGKHKCQVLEMKLQGRY